MTSLILAAMSLAAFLFAADLSWGHGQQKPSSAPAAGAATNRTDPVIETFEHSAVPDRIDPPARPESAFGSVAIPFARIGSKEKWLGIIAELERPPFSFCDRDGNCPERFRVLESAVQNAGRQTFLQRASMANAIGNAALRYAADTENYGVFDHWAGPRESVSRGAGDCEDYVFLKMAILRRLGVPLDSMSVVVLRDTHRDLHHAVLTISTSRGILVLDNTQSELVWDFQLPHYLPLYSFSGDRSWIHGRRTGNGSESGPVTIAAHLTAPASGKRMPHAASLPTRAGAPGIRPTIANEEF